MSISVEPDNLIAWNRHFGVGNVVAEPRLNNGDNVWIVQGSQSM